MPAGYSDLYLDQGSTFTSQITLTDNTGLPYSLNNFVVFASAKRGYGSANTTINLNPTIYNANAGIIQLTANSQITSNIKAGRLVYDVKIQELVSNNVTRVLEGLIYVSPFVS